ncbi:MAG: PfkB family carbohydrate kinase [Christensenellales bacterium]
MQKSILVIEDISCVGRCAALVALPVFAAAGLHATLLPTALLSAHTGGFGAPYRRDLSGDMTAILAHWEDIPLRFDAIHVGYLADELQLPLVRQALRRYRGEGTRLFVDPVMGDWGKRYSGCPEALADGFRALCGEADLIFPNRTEAALLLGQPYSKAADKPETLLEQLRGLLALGAGAAIITGITAGDGFIGAAALDGRLGAPAVSLQPLVAGHWPGTGDLFASAMEAALLLDKALPEALDIAVKFLLRCLEGAPADPALSRFGAPFEGALPWLWKALNL